MSTGCVARTMAGNGNGSGSGELGQRENLSVARLMAVGNAMK